VLLFRRADRAICFAYRPFDSTLGGRHTCSSTALVHVPHLVASLPHSGPCNMLATPAWASAIPFRESSFVMLVPLRILPSQFGFSSPPPLSLCRLRRQRSNRWQFAIHLCDLRLFNYWQSPCVEPTHQTHKPMQPRIPGFRDRFSLGLLDSELA